MSHVVPGESNKPDIPDIGDIYRETEKACEEYEACLTTTIYGDTYLDPEKCKARGYDPIKALEEDEERIKLSTQWIEKTTKEKGFRAQLQEFISKIPQRYVGECSKDPNFLDCFDHLDQPPKKRNKNNKKPSKKNIRSLLAKASNLVDHKIKLEGGLYVKVIAVKMTKDGVFLEVEEKVGDELEYYEIMYQHDMVGL